MCDNLKGNTDYCWNCEIMIWDEIFKGGSVREVIEYIKNSRKEKLSKEVEVQLEMIVRIENLKWDLAESERSLSTQREVIETRDDEIKQLKAENEKMDKMYDELKIKEEMRDSYMDVWQDWPYLKIRYKYRDVVWQFEIQTINIKSVFITKSDWDITIKDYNWKDNSMQGYPEHLKEALDKIEKILNKN